MRIEHSAESKGMNSVQPAFLLLNLQLVESNLPRIHGSVVACLDYPQHFGSQMMQESSDLQRLNLVLPHCCSGVLHHYKMRFPVCWHLALLLLDCF